MSGESFRTEIVVKSHKNCHICDKIAKIAVNEFRETHSQRTVSQSGDHVVEVTKSNAH